MSSTADICNIATSQSIYRVAREIKKQEHSAFNCLCSIAEDAAFVNEIRVLYPGETAFTVIVLYESACPVCLSQSAACLLPEGYCCVPNLCGTIGTWFGNTHHSESKCNTGRVC